jgi:chemotaxis protein MotA
MDRSTSIGLGAGFGLIILGILTEGNILAFWSISSLFIVVGGVFAATLVNFPLDDLLRAMDAARVAFQGRKFDLLARIEMFTMFARRARRNGLLVLDQDIQFIDDRFLKQAMELVVDGTSEENLNLILEAEIGNLKRRHEIGIRVLERMSAYAPAFGMIGTLIGLIIMLGNLDDPNAVGPGMAVALITTFYGAILANLVFTPLAGKLNEYSEKELNEKEMAKQGIISLANGENPRIMERKMLSFVTPRERAEYFRVYGDKAYTAQQEEKVYEHWLNQQKEKWESVISTIPNG